MRNVYAHFTCDSQGCSAMFDTPDLELILPPRWAKVTLNAGTVERYGDIAILCDACVVHFRGMSVKNEH